MLRSPKNNPVTMSVCLALVVLSGAVIAACDVSTSAATQASPMVVASTAWTATEPGQSSSIATPSGTPAPLPVLQATEVEATRRASYAERATQAVRDGQSTLEPYETIWARETSIYVERTQFAESLFTPTPFGPLPFPGTRLTDEELAERGWPRIGAGGVRNEDYHTTAIVCRQLKPDKNSF